MVRGERQIKFLYWNVNKKNLSPFIVDACIENGIDVLILSEYLSVDLVYILRRLEEYGKHFEVEQIDKGSRVLLIHNVDTKIRVINEGKPYYSVFKAKANNDVMLVFAIHLPSLTNLERSDLDLFSVQIAREIMQFEDDNKIEKSIIVGDFNMNPFDIGMVSAFSFNAVMCPEISLKTDKTVLFDDRRFYYNPMWHLLGNYNFIAKGTYYYAKSPKSYYWYTYDQVLLRPSLVEYFNMTGLKILSSINHNNLLNDKGIPNTKRFSDHLPLMFEINMEG